MLLIAMPAIAIGYAVLFVGIWRQLRGRRVLRVRAGSFERLCARETTWGDAPLIAQTLTLQAMLAVLTNANRHFTRKMTEGREKGGRNAAPYSRDLQHHWFGL
jgi:hypothetical protein